MTCLLNIFLESIMYVADLLSRSYDKNNVLNDNILTERVHSVDRILQLSDSKKFEFQKLTNEDKVLSKVIEYHMSGWPAYKSLDDSVKFHYKLSDHLNVEEGLLFNGDRIIVSLKLRNEMLKILHEPHLGTTKTKARARQLLYWPGINNDIENLVLKCSVCEKYQVSNCKEQLINHEIPIYLLKKLVWIFVPMLDQII